MVYILGVNLSHDRSACLLKDGKILVAIEEERLDRLKHSRGILCNTVLRQNNTVSPMKSINYCLNYAGISLDTLDLIVGNIPGNDISAEILKKEIPIKNKNKIKTLPQPGHHLAHAFGVYFASPFKKSAILVVDATGNTTNNSIEAHTFFIGENNRINRIYQELLPVYPLPQNFFSLGFFYEYFTKQLDFYTNLLPADIPEQEVNTKYPEAGKLMGLAPYGKKRIHWEKLIRLENNGKIKIPIQDVKLKYARWKIQDKINDEKIGLKYENQFYKDIAYKVQNELEAAIVHLANDLYQKTKIKNLCFNGGVALNCVANRKILDNTPFKNIFILPPANDAGISIGCAYYGYYSLTGGKKRVPLNTVYLGKEYNEQEILTSLEKYSNIKWLKFRTYQELIKQTAKLISHKKIVGWFQKGAEMGPRALGHRSILADPREPKMKDKLNKRVKHREPFRPYAPSVLEEKVQDFFDIKHKSPFMLLVANVKKGKQKKIPSVVHIDGTVRLQTVNKVDNGIYYDLVKAFYNLTNIPMILNTSFNDNNEPIVETPEDAINCFLKTEMDYLVIGKFLIEI
ncbi:MAG: carbamoyltransferase C-terminal domain-containing protein [Elusimicrobiota bacterium]